jgi:Uma2 family endonuclease
MPSLLTTPPCQPVPPMPRRKRWTREECKALEASGLFAQQHLELVAGELIDRMGKNGPHYTAIALLAIWLRRAFGDLFVLQEVPIDVAPEDNHTSEPEPDVIVTVRELGNFVALNPCPEDLRLVAEVSDSSIGFDMTVKAALYARARIMEYWVLDVNERRLIVHRDPTAGKYTTVTVYREHESVSPITAPHAEFRAADAFPR